VRARGMPALVEVWVAILALAGREDRSGGAAAEEGGRPSEARSGRHAAKAEGHDLDGRGGESSFASPATMSRGSRHRLRTWAGLPRTYQTLVRARGAMAPYDRWGTVRLPVRGERLHVRGSSTAPEAPATSICDHDPRNLRVNDALSLMLPHQERRDSTIKAVLSTHGPRVPERRESDSRRRCWRRRPSVSPRPEKIFYTLKPHDRERPSAGAHARAIQGPLPRRHREEGTSRALRAQDRRGNRRSAMGEAAAQKALGFYKTDLERYPDPPITHEAARPRDSNPKERCPMTKRDPATLHRARSRIAVALVALESPAVAQAADLHTGWTFAGDHLRAYGLGTGR